jgi:hypothetical protein
LHHNQVNVEIVEEFRHFEWIVWRDWQRPAVENAAKAIVGRVPP